MFGEEVRNVVVVLKAQLTSAIFRIGECKVQIEVASKLLGSSTSGGKNWKILDQLGDRHRGHAIQSSDHNASD